MKEKKSPHIYSKEHARSFFLSLIALSFTLALGIHFFMKDSGLGIYLKSSVLESQSKEINMGDVYLEKDDSYIYMKAGKKLNNLISFSTTFLYNGQNIDIKTMVTTLESATIQLIKNEAGIATLLITSDVSQDIQIGQEIVKFIPKKNEKKVEFINISSSNFKDGTGESYMLSSSGIDF